MVGITTYCDEIATTIALAFPPAVHELIQKRESLAGLVHHLYLPARNVLRLHFALR
jgi:hypothetical protein